MWWVPAQALEPSIQSHIVAGCVTLGESLALSVPSVLVSITGMVTIALSPGSTILVSYMTVERSSSAQGISSTCHLVDQAEISTDTEPNRMWRERVKESAHVTMEDREFRDLRLASQRPRRASVSVSVHRQEKTDVPAAGDQAGG